MEIYRILLFSLFEGDAEESNRVQRVKTKLEMWKVQAVDMVCGKYFHYPSFPSALPSFQFLCLLSLSFFLSLFHFLTIPSLHPSYLFFFLPYTGLSIHPSVSLLVHQLAVSNSILVGHQTDHQCISASVHFSIVSFFFTNLA